MRIKLGVKFTCHFVINSQFVPFSQEIQCWRIHTPGAGGQGVQLLEAHWFKHFRSPRKPVLEGKGGGKIHI